MNLVHLLEQAGFRGQALRDAWAIAMRESGGNPAAFNGNASTGDKSYGLFQINMLGGLGPARLRQYGLANNQALLNPAVNARVAYEMSKNGTDFGAWGIGPNAYQGAPAAAYQRYQQLLGQFPGSQGDTTMAHSSAQSRSGAHDAAQTPSISAYLAALNNDPIYRQQIANSKAANAADSASLGSGILNALVTRGEVPDLTHAASELGLSPAIVKWIMNNVDLGHASALAAAGNKAGTSQQAQIDLAHRTNLGNIQDSLAARGMLRSGATPELTGAEAQNYKTQTFNADQALASYINGAYQSFTAAKQGRLTDQNTALENAYQRALQLYGSNPPPAVQHASPDTASTLGSLMPSGSVGPHVSRRLSGRSAFGAGGAASSAMGHITL